MEDHRELLEDLRALASSGPQDAPDRVERRLRAEFRRRSRLQRARLWASYTGAAAAIAAGLGIFAWVRETPKSPATAVASAVAAVAVDDEADSAFYPLPAADSLPAVENAMVVRVQLPVTSLRLMGFPVEEEGADAAVQAELLLGQDGLARGVRLVE